MSPAVIVRLPNWLGDTVMAVPALRAARAHWRETRVILAGPWASLLAGQGLGDVLVDYPRAWPGRLRTADSVRALRADLAVLLPGSLESAVAARYWGARRIAGFAVGGRSWLLTDPVPLPAPRQHQVDEYRLLVEHLGAAAPERAPRMAAPDPASPARREVRALLDGLGATDRRPRIGLHLGAAFGPAKVWPRGRMIGFCQVLDRAGRAVVLLGAPGDGELAGSVAAAAPALNLVGRDRPELLPALLAEMDVLVCGDTGVGHLAAAIGVPVVALFGPTDPTLTAPRGAGAVARHAVPCAPCFYRRCPIEHPCLAGIEVEAVQDHVEDALAAR
jgi:heptosyltransferase-2